MTEAARAAGGENAAAGQLAEGYPSLASILRGINSDEEIPDAGVRRIELNAFASGEATYNVWTVGAEEPTGGYLAKSDLT